MSLVEVGIAEVVEHEGCVGTLGEQTGISAGVGEGQAADALAVGKLEFGFGASACLADVGERLDDAFAGVGHDIAHVVVLFDDG